MRRLLLLAAVTGGTCAAVAAALQTGIGLVEQRLEHHKLSWSARTIGPRDWTWTEISGPGLEAKSISISLGWPTRVMVDSPAIDLEQWLHDDSGKGQTKTRGWRPPYTLEVSGTQLLWADDILTHSLSGQVYPKLTLSDGQTEIHATWHQKPETLMSGWVHGDFPHDQVYGAGRLNFSIGKRMSFELDFPKAQPDHPFIARARMPQNPMKARGVWDQKTGELAAEGSLGEVKWTATGIAKPDSYALDIRVPLTPLSDVVALFDDQIPEAKHAVIRGEMGLTAAITGPSLAMRFEPGARDLSVNGALPDSHSGQVIRWTTKRDDDAAPVHHMTGPRTSGWINKASAGWMPDAVIASEDIRFLSHPGFDLVAIQESLANAKSDERMRGGSTITQQLAKNLFLDGRRTLLRKLRELILALSLEDRMSKDAILTLYLNVVEFGPGIWGIRDAADAWFLKTPDRLTPREAAFLASILPAPRMWHEKISTTGKVPISRVNEVLARMRLRGSLSQTQYDQARAEKLRVVPPQPKG